MLLQEKHLVLFAFFLMLFINLQSTLAQQWKWVINGSGNHQYSDADRDIAVDNNGNQFIAGYFTKTLTLGSITLISPDDYYSDMFVARIDSGGNVIWAKMIDLGTTYNEAMGLSLDDSSNIYLTGAYNGKIFVSKYDSSGSLKWNSDILQKSLYGYGRDISVDQYENIFITGEQDGSAIVAKLNRDGIFQWSSKLQGCNSNGAWGNDLAVDRLGNCYVAGGFNCDSLKVGNTVLRKASWQPYTFLVKYSPEGEVIWVKMPVGGTNEIPQVALTDSGYVILAGTFSQQIVFNNSITVTPYIYGQSSFIATYDTAGNVIWARNGTKYESTPRDIVADHDGNIYLGGTRFGNYGGTYMDFHLIKYNSDGDTVYTRDVLGGDEYLYGLDIDNSGNNYLVGHADVKGLGVIEPAYMNPYSVYVGKFNTGSTTSKRPNKPLIERNFVVCYGTNLPSLFAKGNSINWYKDSLLKDLIASGNNYLPNITKTDTLYVTQTVNNIQSWPKQIIINISNLTSFSIEERNDSLLAPNSASYTYQWYLDNVPLNDSIGGKKQTIKVFKTGTYKVIVTDNIGCSKDASYTVSPPTNLKFAATKDGHSGLIYWEVAKEADIKEFELEKTGNNVDFKRLALINRGLDSATKFTYADKYLFEGNNYYRLKIVSKNGRSVISDTIVLTDEKEPSVRVAPNPVVTDLRFSLTGSRGAADFTAKILDANGNVLYNRSFSISNREIKELKVGFLTSGIYFLELSDGTNKYTSTFIKK